jgi:hypothetical protein
MLAYMANNYDTQLGNLWRSLAMALNAADQAQNDYNAVRMRAGLPPFQAFHLSAAMAVEARVGPKGDVRLSAAQRDDVVAMILDSSRFAKGEVISVAEARRQRLNKDR